MLQQSPLAALLGTTDHFFAGHTHLVARHGSKAGRGSWGTRRRGPYLGARQLHWEPQGLQRCRQRHANTTIVFGDSVCAIIQYKGHDHTIGHFLVV
jgi:hypothetical protein